MSETVHYKGIATKIECSNEGLNNNQMAEQILKERGKTVEDYYDSALECLCGEFYHEYFYHKKTDTLYKLENKEHEPDEEIIRAEDKTENIEYELRYYNGGAGFEECLEEAFDKL